MRKFSAGNTFVKQETDRRYTNKRQYVILLVCASLIQVTSFPPPLEPTTRTFTMNAPPPPPHTHTRTNKQQQQQKYSNKNRNTVITTYTMNTARITDLPDLVMTISDCNLWKRCQRSLDSSSTWGSSWTSGSLTSMARTPRGRPSPWGGGRKSPGVSPARPMAFWSLGKRGEPRPCPGWRGSPGR